MKKISNNIEMNKISLEKLSKAELIALLMKQQIRKPKIIVVDDTKPSPKPIEKPKKVVHTQDDLLNNDPFPDFVITNNPFERKMDKVNNKKRGIDEQSFDIDSKYQKLMSEPEADTSTQKIRYYPKIETTLGEFRKDEMKFSNDKLKQKKSFYKLFETRLENIPGNRETVSISIDVVIKKRSLTDKKLRKKLIEKYKNEPITQGDDIDEYQIPYKKVIKQRLFHAKEDDSIGEKEFVEKNYGPFTVEKPVNLSAHDTYKFAMYTLLKKDFNILSGEYITAIGIDKT